MSFKNPIENPNNISPSINNTVKNMIKEEFARKGSLEFFDIMAHLEYYVSEKDIKTSKIVAFYCINMIIFAKNILDKDKQELIDGICKEIIDLEYKISQDKANVDDLYFEN
jgi:hypothetical protein